MTTDAAGDATVYSNAVNGRVLAIIYTKDDFAAGVDFTITSETTGQGLWTEADVNASKTVHPHVAAHDTTGTGITFDGTNETYRRVWLAGERVEFVIANGGDSKSGAFTLIVG